LAFDNMPFIGPMLMPGAPEYADECIRLARQAAQNHRVEMDIPYGIDPFQQLDVWSPMHSAGVPLPVILLLHGGAMRNGFKEWIGAMAPAMCGLPAVLVSANYRLVPRVRLVDALADCMDALAWVHSNIARFGGDPTRIHVGGHSAGAFYAALLSLRHEDRAARGIGPGVVKGALLVSGIYTMEKREIDPQGMRARFWTEMVASDAEAIEVSAYRFIAGNRTPFLVAHGENEPAEVLADSCRMMDTARTGGFLHEGLVFPGCDHFQAHLACNDPDGAFMRATRTLVNGGTA
jgi:arylformamidase